MDGRFPPTRPQANSMTEPSHGVFEDRPELFVGTIENCAVVIWRATPTVDTAKLAARHFSKFEGEAGRGFALVAIITANCAPVGPDVRQAFDEAMRAHREAALGMAAVIEVQGVLGGLTRAMARTMSIVTRSPYPTNTFATVKSASEWMPYILSQRGAPELSPSVISDFVENHRHPA
ncbi:MAG: hypothetical protein AAF799_21310 [Myxococcota bacterium]